MRYYFKIMTCLLLLIIFGCKTDNSTSDIADSVLKEVREWTSEDTRSLTGVYSKRGLLHQSESATPGYILFNPASSTSTYLINKQGDVVHEWKGELNSMQAYLRDNGNLVRLERDIDFPTFAAGGQAGRIREYTWDGEVVWDFEYADEKNLIHHDVALMSNGNILAISYEAKTQAEAINAGRNPEHVSPAGIWPDKIIEIKPTLPFGGEIVWEWKMWDHLVQDFNPEKDNYGSIAEHPRKININVGESHGPPMTEEMVEGLKQQGMITSNATADNMSSDITHTNAIYYHEDLDQIAISSPGYSEIFIIDHSTTIAEAKGSSGGKYGHGGDLLFRWGNPQNYGQGDPDDRILYHQHDIRWIPKGHPGEGNMMVFNNDKPGPKSRLPNAFAAVMEAQTPDPQVSIGDVSNYSTVIEFTPAMSSPGEYILKDGKFGPQEATWEYIAPDKYSFYSAYVSGAYRLKNGHTLVLSGAQGRMFEIDKNKDIVWEYWQPYNDEYKLPDGSPSQPGGPFIFNLFRVLHVEADAPGIKGKDLSPISPQPKPFIPPPPPPVTEDE